MSDLTVKYPDAVGGYFLDSDERQLILDSLITQRRACEEGSAEELEVIVVITKFIHYDYAISIRPDPIRAEGKKIAQTIEEDPEIAEMLDDLDLDRHDRERLLLSIGVFQHTHAGSD